jgi:CRP/FNR family cyclic AMP-dependent transcriptional regulator
MNGQTGPPRTGAGSSSAPSDRAGRVVHDLGVLAELPLFRGLTEDQLSKLSTHLHHKRYPARTEIIRVNQPGEIAYIILEGSVKIHLDQPDGTDVILAILGAGEILGEMSLADSLGRSATVATLESSTFLLMDRVTFWASLKEMPTMTYNLVDILSRRLRLANLHTQALARLDVHGRVAAQLLAFAYEYGETAPNGDVLVPLRLTQGDLASMVGASRVRVNQALSFYKRRNYLSLNHNHHIIVHDPAALRRRCS